MSRIFFRKIFLAVFLPIFLQSQFSLAAKTSEYFQFSPSKFSENKIVVEAWNSEEGMSRLNRSEYKNDFYELVNFFQPQINPLYCGIASSVIILNAIHAKKGDIESQKDLQVTKPNSLGGGLIPFNSYSQSTFLNEKTDKIKNRDIINLRNFSEIEEDKSKADPGLTLDQLANMLSKVHQLKVKTFHIAKIDEKDISNFREKLKKILSDKDNYLIANFDGKTLGLKTGGHISPIVSYDEISDSALVMDVAGHKNPWYWVEIEYLYKAMNTLDGDTHRGYLVVSE